MSSHGIPEVLMKKVDEYVDSLAPQIQPHITTELEVFQQKTIDVLEAQVVDAFRSLFDRDGDAPSGSSRSLEGGIPSDYGGLSLPFANEIASLTGSLSKMADETGDDLRDIFNLTEGGGHDGPGGTGSGNSRSLGGEEQHADGSQRVRGFLSAAVNAVQDHLENSNQGPGGGGGGQRLELDGLLGVLSGSIKEVARSPEETARRISPDIKEKVAAKLRDQHGPIAEQFTRIALEHIKRWLRGNTSTRDLGDGARGEIEDHVKDLVKGLGGLFGSKKQHHGGEESSRGFGDRDGEGEGGGGSSSGGFSKLISEKLSTGLGKVHREVRLEFRKILGGIEKQLFELLPDELQRPLEKILGGNPFDAQLERDAAPNADRGFRDDLKTKLVGKIRGLVRRVQEALRENILGVVNGGHRKFERASWVFVQGTVEQKVQRYLPKVQIHVPDDIGNEGVSLGAPAPSAQQPGGSSGGGDQPVPPPPPYGHQQESRPDQHQAPYQPHQEHRPDQYQPHQYQPHQEYRPDQYQPHQEYRPDQYPPPPSYPPSHQSYQPQNYQQNQGNQGGQWHGQNPSY